MEAHYPTNPRYHTAQETILIRNAINKKSLRTGFDVKEAKGDDRGSVRYNRRSSSTVLLPEERSRKRAHRTISTGAFADQRESRDGGAHIEASCPPMGADTLSAAEEPVSQISPSRPVLQAFRSKVLSQSVENLRQYILDPDDPQVGDDTRFYEPYRVPPFKHYREGYMLHPDAHLCQPFDTPDPYVQPGTEQTYYNCYESIPITPENSRHLEYQEFDAHDGPTLYAPAFPVSQTGGNGSSPNEIFMDSGGGCRTQESRSFASDEEESIRQNIPQIVDSCTGWSRNDSKPSPAGYLEHDVPEKRQAGSFNSHSLHASRSPNDKLLQVLQEQHSRKPSTIFERNKKEPAKGSVSATDKRPSSTRRVTSSSPCATSGFPLHCSVAEMKEAVRKMSRIKLPPRRSTYRQVRLGGINKIPGSSCKLTGKCVDHKTSEDAMTTLGTASEFMAHGAARPYDEAVDEIDQGLLYLELEQMLDDMNSSLPKPRHVSSGNPDSSRSTIERLPDVQSGKSTVDVEGSGRKTLTPLDGVRRQICKVVRSGEPAVMAFSVDIGMPDMVLCIDVRTDVRQRLEHSSRIGRHQKASVYQDTLGLDRKL